MDLGLGGKTVLITGGSRGIGYATARVFASEGTDLHLVSRTREDLERARNAIRSEFPVAVDIHVADLSSGEQILAVAHACADADILVNNAGAIPLGTLLDVDDETWRAAWDLKLFGYITMMRAMYDEMKARGPRCHRQQHRHGGRPEAVRLRRRSDGQWCACHTDTRARWNKP